MIRQEVITLAKKIDVLKEQELRAKYQRKEAKKILIRLNRMIKWGKDLEIGMYSPLAYKIERTIEANNYIGLLTVLAEAGY